MQCGNIIPAVRRIEDELEKIGPIVRWTVNKYSSLPVNISMEELIHEVQSAYFINSKCWSSSYVVNTTLWIIRNLKKPLAVEPKEGSYHEEFLLDKLDLCENMLKWSEWNKAELSYLKLKLKGNTDSDIERELGVSRQRVNRLKQIVISKGKVWAGQHPV